MATAELIAPTIAAHPHDYRLPPYPETPVDEATGLPWCFTPNPDLPAPLIRGNNERRADWNHQFPQVEVKYSANPVFDELGKMALVGLRLQWVDYREHHEVYNHHFIGPRQPATQQQLVTTLIMGMAGYVPPMALDLSGKKPSERLLRSDERDWLWRSGQLRTISGGEVSKYLLRYVMAQDHDHIDQRALDEFMHTYVHKRRLELGHRLAAKLVERAVEPLEPLYSAARRQGGIMADVPRHPRDFVKPRLAGGQRYGKVFNALFHKFGARGNEMLLA